MQLKEFLDESSFIHLISSTQPNRGASLKQLELCRLSKPAVTVRVEPDTSSTAPLLDYQTNVLSKDNINPCCQSVVRNDINQLSRCWVILCRYSQFKEIKCLVDDGS